jgi:hypothetical protein
MYKLDEPFQKELFERVINKFSSSLKASKFLNIPASSIRGYKNLYFDTIPEELIFKLIELKLVNGREIEKRVLEKVSKEDLIERSFSKGRFFLKEKFLRIHKEIPKLHEIFKGDCLDVRVWFEKYIYLLNSGFRSVSVKYYRKYFQLSYSNFNGFGFKDFVVKIPNRFDIDNEFLYFFGLWCGDRSGGKRFGVCNKNQEILKFTESFLKKNYQNVEKILYMGKLIKKPDVEYDKKFVIGPDKKGWVLSVHSGNGVLSSFFHYLRNNLADLICLINNKEPFFAGLFDAEGNVSLYNKSFRWACKNERLIETYSHFLKKMNLFDRYDGNCLVSYNKSLFYTRILPYMKQKDKINLTKFMVKGFPMPPEYKDIIKFIRKNPKMTSKDIAKALKKNKLYSELKLLNDFGFISVEGYPSKFEITSKGLKELGEK